MIEKNVDWEVFMKHLEHFHELKSLTRKQKFFCCRCFLFILWSLGCFCSQSRKSVRESCV